MIRSHSSHLSQVVRRVNEAENFELKENVDKNFKFTISHKTGDNCFITIDHKVCVIVEKCVETDSCIVPFLEFMS